MFLCAEIQKEISKGVTTMTIASDLAQGTVQVTQQSVDNHRLKSLSRRACLVEMQKTQVVSLPFLQAPPLKQCSERADLLGRQEQARRQRLVRRLAANGGHTLLHLAAKHDALQAKYETLQADYQQLLAEEQKRQDMVNMLIHDLKVPLGAILVSLELLTIDFDEGEGGDQRDILGVADQAARQMLQLIAGLLEVRKLESGRMPIQLQALDLVVLLKHIVQQAQLLASQKQVTLHLDLPAAVPHVQADPSLAARVVTNLLDNAIKFTPHGSQVIVTCQAQAKEITIAVADGGPGIPADEQEIVFETFSQVDRGDYPTQAGVGLGLAFCKLAIEAQHGRIWVESEPKLASGTRFKFTLPVWQSSPDLSGGPD
jgi:signal transduction histidine kinase